MRSPGVPSGAGTGMGSGVACATSAATSTERAWAAPGSPGYSASRSCMWSAACGKRSARNSASPQPSWACGRWARAVATIAPVSASGSVTA